jgi:CheY-like chemotaxis protein/two-component sensor histidine kinase
VPQELDDELRDAREAADRVRSIVRDLNVLSRGDDEARVAVEVPKVLDSTLRIAWNEVRHRARLVRQYERVPLVHASESRLGQVFLNLLLNAAQAIPEGHADTNEITVATRTDKSGCAVIEVTDTGAGIAPDVLPRLFTPFFTTKAAGVGTGLGLAICHRIVVGLGGDIAVESVVGRGTTFRVTMPAAPGVRRTTAPPISPRSSTAPRRGNVLVVDDDALVLSTVRRILDEEHDVTVTRHAAEAARWLRQGRRFDVIVCDLMMPLVSGMDLYDEVAALDTSLCARFVFATGGAFTPRAQAFLERVPNTRLDKPFDLDELRALVNGLVR